MRWTNEDKAKVAEAMAAGLTSSQIASIFNTTKGAVMGVAFRDPFLRAIGFKAPQSLRSRAEKKEKPKLFREYHRTGDVVHPFGIKSVPLMALNRGVCKWPVNDAPRGVEHLFCGLPADGPYCAHHAGYAYRPGQQGETR